MIYLVIWAVFFAFLLLGIFLSNKTGFSVAALGAVCNWFVKRILRQKAADARRKYEPMPSIGECF